MRVGIYVPDWGPETGGAHAFVRAILAAVAQAGGRHEFLVLHPPEAAGVDETGLPSFALPAASSPLEPTLAAAVREHAVELVWFVAPESQPVDVPYIATVWDLEHRNQPFFPEVSVSGWTWEQRELYYRTVLPRAACVIVGTAEGKRQIERYYAVPSANVAVVPFPIPSFSPEELAGGTARLAPFALRSPYLFYPAQFWPHKNHVVLLKALRQLVDSGSTFDLVLTGSDKGNLGYVHSIAAELGIEERVHFLGFVERSTLVALYREAAALVFPSYFGPDNLPPLEAFALGCPVIAAAVVGAEERLGDAALLFDPRDARALAAAMRRLQSDPALRDELIRRGLERASSWSPAQYVQAIVARCDDLASVRSCWSATAPYVHP